MKRQFVNIGDLNAGKKNVYIREVEVLETDMKEVEVKGKKHKICEGKIKDNTGEIRISAWDNQADKLNKANKIKVWNCYCKRYGGDLEEYKGNLELTTGIWGRIFVLK